MSGVKLSPKTGEAILRGVIITLGLTALELKPLTILKDIRETYKNSTNSKKKDSPYVVDNSHPGLLAAPCLT